MEIRIYTWKSCPEVYKALGPYTEHFFSSGGYVTLVMVIAENNDSRDITPAELKNILASFKYEPTNQVLSKVSGKKTMILFWTNEAQ